MRSALEAATGLEVVGTPSGLGSGGGFAACHRWECTGGPGLVKVMVWGAFGVTADEGFDAGPVPGVFSAVTMNV